MKYNASLVLEGGGMRSAYTNGVLDYFMENDIEFEYIVGVSAGSGTAMNFISKQPKRSSILNIDYAKDRRVVGVNNWIFKGSYFNLRNLYSVIEDEVYFDKETFSKNNVDFRCGCFNIESGEVEYFNKREIEHSNEPLIATSSLPIVSKYVKIRNKKYLDGGIVDSIPFLKSVEDGNEKHVIILTNPIDYVREPEKTLWLMKLIYFRYPKLIEAMSRRHEVYNNTLEMINKLEQENKIFIIRPSVKLEVSRYTRDRETLEAAYEQGKIDAKNMKSALIEYLNGPNTFKK